MCQPILYMYIRFLIQAKRLFLCFFLYSFTYICSWTKGICTPLDVYQCPPCCRPYDQYIIGAIHRVENRCVCMCVCVSTRVRARVHAPIYIYVTARFATSSPFRNRPLLIQSNNGNNALITYTVIILNTISS